MNFWKKKKTNHHHHHHHRENVSDNISIGREEKRERERERDSRLVRDREKRSRRRRRRHIPHVPSHWREERKREKIFEFVAQKKKKRFPKRLNAKWEKDAHLAPATTSGFCRRSRRRFSRGFFLDVLVREPFRGRRASRALPFAHCIKSQSVLRQRQPVSLVLILRSPLLSFFLSCIRIIIRWRYFFFVHNVNPHDFANDGADPFLCAFFVLSNAFHV